MLSVVSAIKCKLHRLCEIVCAFCVKLLVITSGFP